MNRPLPPLDVEGVPAIYLTHHQVNQHVLPRMFKVKLPKTHRAKAPKLKQQRGIILHTSRVDIWLLELKLQEIFGTGNYQIDVGTFAKLYMHSF